MYLGIDPGITGAWAVIDYDSQIVAWGSGQEAIKDFIAWPGEYRPIKSCYLENQGLRHSDRHGKQFHVQKLIVNFGMWQGILTAYDIPFKLIAPMTWLSRYKCACRMKPNERKQAYVAVARTLWPDRKWIGKDHDLAAACLMAELARVDYNLGGK